MASNTDSRYGIRVRRFPNRWTLLHVPRNKSELLDAIIDIGWDRDFDPLTRLALMGADVVDAATAVRKYAGIVVQPHEHVGLRDAFAG